MNAVVIRTDWANRMENGMLRDLEDAFIRATGASVVPHPRPDLPPFLKKRIQRGTRYESLRRFVPKARVDVRADVLFVPMQAPEDFQLDQFKGWDAAKTKILYLFDTFPHQYRLTAEVASATKWDFLITSFNDAVPHLEKLTGKKWHTVAQAVDLDRFYPRQFVQGQPPITICSYGRRLEDYHREILRWARSRCLWYDYMTGPSAQLLVPTTDHYEVYANHIGSSLFNVCWPLELTHPARGGHLSPLTCRWFEVAASCNVIVGKRLPNPIFDRWFDRDFVQTAPEASQVGRWLDGLLEKSGDLRKAAMARREKMKDTWTWKSRVDEILGLLGRA